MVGLVSQGIPVPSVAGFTSSLTKKVELLTPLLTFRPSNKEQRVRVKVVFIESQNKLIEI